MRIVAVIEVQRAQLESFRTFEALAVERMAVHGARLDDVVVVDDAQGVVTEIHLLHFPSAAAWAAYRDDAVLAAARPQRDQCVLRQQVWVGEAGPRYAPTLAAFRRALIDALAGHTAADAREATDLAVMRFAAQALAHPTARDTLPGHFTASALVVDESLTRVCLLHHVKLARWLQPGGHVEPGDADLVQAALREAREETGLAVAAHPAAPGLFDVDVHVIPARKAEPEHQHLDLRVLVLAPFEAPRPPSGESQQVRWFSLGEARALPLDAALLRLLGKVERLAAQRPVR